MEFLLLVLAFYLLFSVPSYASFKLKRAKKQLKKAKKVVRKAKRLQMELEAMQPPKRHQRANLKLIEGEKR